MPLETATYISDLVPSNPAHSDGLNQADAHSRLIKSTLQSTFPNITGAVTASHTQLNSILSQLLGTTVYTAPLGAVGAPSYSFLGDLDTGWYSPGANRAALSLGGADALNFAADKKATFAAGAAFGGAITGPGIVPIGGMLMWLSDTLPVAGTNGTYCWANGGTLSRTTVGAGKELFDLIGTTYGIGDGATTFNVINMQEVVPVGKSTMGGAASPGLLPSIITGLKTVLNGLFGSDTNTLTNANLPAHQHDVFLKDNGHRHQVFRNNGVGGGSTFVAYDAVTTGSFGGSNLTNPTEYPLTNSNITIGSINGTANDNKTSSVGAGTAVNNVSPSRAVNFIIRIA